MDPGRFDDLTRRLASKTSRRRFLTGVGAGGVGALVLPGVAGASTSPAKLLVECAEFCGQVFPRNVEGALQCALEAVKREGLCYECGPGAPAGHPPVCGTTCCGAGTSCCKNVCVATTTVSNCGACGVACAEGETCCGGTCVSLSSSSANCGACGTSCSSTEACCDGVCTDITSNCNCGTCGNQCTGANGYCTNESGSYVCAGSCAEYDYCNGNGTCVDGECQCYPPPEGSVYGPNCALPPAPDSCNSAADCYPGLRCMGGQCVCTVDSDCGTGGATCVDGQCACTTQSDCSPYFCDGGICDETLPYCYNNGNYCSGNGSCSADGVSCECVSGYMSPSTGYYDCSVPVCS